MGQNELFDTGKPEQTPLEDRFEEFWCLCPRKAGKARARKAWIKARKHTTADRLIDAMARYARSDQVQAEETRYIPHPSTWLNEHRFEDVLGGDGEDAQPDVAPLDMPRDMVYLQTDPVGRPRYRESVPKKDLPRVLRYIRHSVFEHLQSCTKPICEVCDNPEVQEYRKAFLAQYGPERCSFPEKQ